MVKHHIFIAHTSKNEEYARMICSSLSNIVEFEPYLAQDYPSYGENFKDRIQNAIENCNIFIVCFSESALTNQWVNQELGYACAVRKKNPRRYHIIPISRSDLDLRGMITHDSVDILFEDKYSPEELVANIILSMRNKILGGHKYGSLHFKVICKNCRDNLNLPTEYQVPLPEQQNLLRTISTDEDTWYSTCPNCDHRNYVNIYTWNESEGKKTLSID